MRTSAKRETPPNSSERTIVVIPMFAGEVKERLAAKPFAEVTDAAPLKCRSLLCCSKIQPYGKLHLPWCIGIRRRKEFGVDLKLAGILFPLDGAGIGDELACGVVKTIVTDVHPIVGAVE